MKTLTIISFLLLATIHSYGQQVSDKLFYEQKVGKYKKMKTTGTVLTLCGGTLFIVGIVTLVNSSIDIYDDGYGNTKTTTTGNPGAGAAATLVGIAGLGSGIPLWIIGNKSQRKYENKLKNISVGFNFNPQRSGLKLTYRF